MSQESRPIQYTEQVTKEELTAYRKVAGAAGVEVEVIAGQGQEYQVRGLHAGTERNRTLGNRLAIVVTAPSENNVTAFQSRSRAIPHT